MMAMMAGPLHFEICFVDCHHHKQMRLFERFPSVQVAVGQRNCLLAWPCALGVGEPKDFS